MPVDPRLDGLAAASDTDPTRAALRALNERVGNLERLLAARASQPLVQTVTGVPTLAARDGTLALDTSQLKLWVRRNGTWVAATLA